jgi:hypothetical protein
MNDYPVMFSVHKQNKIVTRGYKTCVTCHLDYIHYTNRYCCKFRRECILKRYDSILKTRLGLVVFDDNKEMARKRLQQAGIPEEQINELAIYGTPEDVLGQKESLDDAGIQYLIVSLDPSKEVEALDIFANNIIKRS